MDTLYVEFYLFHNRPDQADFSARELIAYPALFVNIFGDCYKPHSAGDDSKGVPKISEPTVRTVTLENR